MNKKLLITGIIAGILLLGVIFTIFILPAINAKKNIEIPDVSGYTVKKAEQKLEKKGFEVAVKTKKQTSDKVKEGRVIETDPEAGRSVKKGTQITLIVSKGSKKIKIEDYTGKDYYEVKATLEALGLKVSTEQKDVAADEGTKENTILSQDVKPGTKLKKGDIITFTVPNLYVTYPDFAKEDYTVVDVRNFCTKNELTLEVKYQSDSSKENGTIIYQNMVAGTKVNKGTTLTITVVKNETPKSDTSKTDKTDKTEENE